MSIKSSQPLIGQSIGTRAGQLYNSWSIHRNLQLKLTLEDMNTSSTPIIKKLTILPTPVTIMPQRTKVISILPKPPTMKTLLVNEKKPYYARPWETDYSTKKCNPCNPNASTIKHLIYPSLVKQKPIPSFIKIQPVTMLQDIDYDLIANNECMKQQFLLKNKVIIYKCEY